MLTLVLVALSTIPYSDIVVDRVSRVEINHLYNTYMDGEPTLTFVQIIYYNWDSDLCNYVVVEWRLLKDLSQLPQYDYQKRKYVSTWSDDGHYHIEGNFMRMIESDSLVETFTQYDPELINRELLPKEKRVGFSKPIVKKKATK